MEKTELEAIVLYLAAGEIRHVYPPKRQTLRAPWDPDFDPSESMVDAVAGLGFSPVMVHSTSWRVENRRIVLTFLVVIEAPGALPTGFEEELAARTDLSPGRAMGPPPAVHLTQVVEH